VGGGRRQETFLLIANTSAFDGTARVRLMFENGETMDHHVTLAANSRTTVSVRDAFPSAEGRRFGATITSTASEGAATPAQLVVERAMYANANGITWASGTNLLGTKLR
jgi:pyocin large subunit-like protein